MTRLKVLLAVCLYLSTAAAQQKVPFGKHLDGVEIKDPGPNGAKAVVLFFVATDCPVSDRSFPEMIRLSREFKRKGVQFWFVYPNATESQDAVRKHQRAFDPDDEAILDPADSLVQLAGAKVTPEAAVLVPAGTGAWKAVYRGRIDDRFVRIGLERPAATQRLVEQAVRAVLAGKPVDPDPATPVGCSIVTRRAGQR